VSDFLIVRKFLPSIFQVSCDGVQSISYVCHSVKVLKDPSSARILSSGFEEGVSSFNQLDLWWIAADEG
jgi:hypothetical protein